VRDLRTTAGRVDMVAPHIRRIVAPNPSAFTFLGTGTYIVGYDRVAVIDPGPRDDAHIDALLDALRGETVEAILITHTHGDHSPGASVMRARGIDAPVYGFGPHPTSREEDERVDASEGRVEERSDTDFVPDVRVTTGDVIHGYGWTFDVLHTPGHISNHLCFAFREEQALFTGDHIMGWATTIIPPPDGSVADYLASLQLVLDRDDAVLWPTHGPPIHHPEPYVRALLAHRIEREQQVLALLAGGPRTIVQMVRTMYRGYPKELRKPAGRSVWAQLLKLVDDGRVVSDGPPIPTAVYSLRATPSA
jgi:glyoxylase-like metal-dependent hydrolase (beta-lactamase superfamily II)